MDILQHFICVVVMTEFHLFEQVESIDLNETITVSDHADILRVLPQLGAWLREENVLLSVVNLVARFKQDSEDVAVKQA